MRFLAISLLAFALAGCGLVHKIDVQQGNYVTEDAVAKVRNGMTKAEVRLVLGTPLLVDAFHANRWDYYFSNAKGGRSTGDRKRFSVFFENEKVVSFGGTAQPPAPPPVGTPPQPVVR